MPLYSCAGYTPVVDPTAFVHPSANLQDHCVMHTFPGRVALVEENGHVGHGAGIMDNVVIGVPAREADLSPGVSALALDGTHVVSCHLAG
jgi:phenylacetic acid degradation protein